MPASHSGQAGSTCHGLSRCSGGPLVDLYSTKRRWILSTQFAMSVCLFVTAYALNTEGYFFLSLSAFAVGAFISATHDIATDGFYMLALRKKSKLCS